MKSQYNIEDQSMLGEEREGKSQVEKDAFMNQIK